MGWRTISMAGSYGRRCVSSCLVLLFFCVGFFVFAGVPALTVTLTDAFNAASSGGGYDTLVMLDPAIVYEGGLAVPGGNHAIRGNGAVIDLMGGSVTVGAGDRLDVFGCTFRNGIVGGAALNYLDGAKGCVIGNNFFGNFNGIQYWTATTVYITDNNVTNNANYGIYRHEYCAEDYLSHNNVWNNAGMYGGNYVELCPG